MAVQVTKISELVQKAIDAGHCEWGGQGSLVICYGANAETPDDAESEWREKAEAVATIFQPDYDFETFDSGSNNLGFYSTIGLRDDVLYPLRREQLAEDEAKIIKHAHEMAAAFVEEFDDALDPDATEWDAEAFDSNLFEGAAVFWPMFQSALVAETERLASAKHIGS